MKTFVTILLFLVLSGVQGIKGQDLNSVYNSAINEFKLGNFDESIKLSNQIKKMLGSTNPKIEALLAKAYFNDSNILEAKLAYEKLLKLIPSPQKQSSSFKSFLALGKQINEALEREEEEHEEALKDIDNKRLQEANQVEQQWLAKEEERKRTIQR